MKSFISKTVRAGVCLLIGMLIWLPSVRFFFAPRSSEIVAESGVPSLAKELAQRQVALWTDPELLKIELSKMTRVNAEWDFMGRTYLVLAMANICLRDPSTSAENLGAMDRIIDQTVQPEKSEGMFHFMMPYAQRGRFVEQPPRSLFIDSEIALMMAARRMVEEKEEYKTPMWERLNESMRRVEKSPVLLEESYPDECWVFDHANLLAAVRMGDALDHEDHRAFCVKWIEAARKNLVDPHTGLLISSATSGGDVGDGPEGSSIWMTAAAPQLVDPVFAKDQYDRASRELDRGALGFSWAGEWPRSWRGRDDVDSGPVIPVLDLSAGSSGMSILAAGAFGDERKLTGLIATLNFGAFPTRDATGLRYAASNQVGDAVLLYALVQGPLWERTRERTGK